MKTFYEWLIQESNQVNQQQANQIISSHKGPISAEGMRTDMIDQAFKVGNQVEYDANFPINNISTRMQGFSMDSVVEIINKMLQAIGVQPVANAQDVKSIPNLQSLYPKLIDMIPPAIISILPDGTVSLMDGNHRYGVSKVLGLPTIKTFIIR
jgi:hypothetical protein